jgi:hypothetical protein
MAIALDMLALSPFEALAEYERRSLAHVAGVPEQIDAPGLWRGIGFRIGTRYLVSSINEVNEILTFPSLTLVPGTRHWLLGVANVRGNLVPLIDLKQYLEGERALLTESSRVRRQCRTARGRSTRSAQLLRRTARRRDRRRRRSLSPFRRRKISIGRGLLGPIQHGSAGAYAGFRPGFGLSGLPT